MIVTRLSLGGKSKTLPKRDQGNHQFIKTKDYKQRITNKGLQTKSPQVPTPARLLARRLAPPQSWKEEQEGPAVTAGNCNVASNIISFIFHFYRELGSIEGEAAKVNGELAAPNGQPLQVGHLSRICISVVYLEKCKII